MFKKLFSKEKTPLYNRTPCYKSWCRIDVAKCGIARYSGFDKCTECENYIKPQDSIKVTCPTGQVVQLKTPDLEEVEKYSNEKPVDKIKCINNDYTQIKINDTYNKNIVKKVKFVNNDDPQINEFKPGDKVKCINNSGDDSQIKVNETYTIKNSFKNFGSTFVTLEEFGDNYSWWYFRFEIDQSLKYKNMGKKERLTNIIREELGRSQTPSILKNGCIGNGNIIDEGNLEPKPNAEYIYNMDMIWKRSSIENFPVKKGTIVINVEQLDAGNYSFNIKGDPQIYICSYGWAFIENTERNIELLKQIETETILLSQQELKIESLRNNLDRLYKSYKKVCSDEKGCC